MGYWPLYNYQDTRNARFMNEDAVALFHIFLYCVFWVLGYLNSYKKLILELRKPVVQDAWKVNKALVKEIVVELRLFKDENAQKEL